jgi:CSLREA domain-containing protein
MNTQSTFQRKEKVNSANTAAGRFIGLLAIIGLFVAPVSYVNAESDYERYCVGGLGIIVTTFEDDEEDYTGCTADHCTLREAINTANLCTDDTTGTVVLENGAYTLNRSANNDPADEQHLISALVISGNVVIIGDESTITRESEALFRIFLVNYSASLSANDVSIGKGKVYGTMDDVTYGGAGGGIFVEKSGKLSLLRSRVWGSGAWHGGGIYNAGDLTLRQTMVISNHAILSGGGIFNADNAKAFIHQSSVGGNFSEGGGAISNSNGLLIVKSSTISGNKAESGGGISTRRGKLILRDSTIYRNSANPLYSAANWSDGIFEPIDTAFGQGGGLVLLSNALISNTVIAENTPRNCTGEWDRGREITQIFTSDGISMASDVSCSFHTAFTMVESDPMLDDVEIPNLYTAYFQPLPGSPLIDAGEKCDSYDQRSKVRHLDGNGDGIKECDIGAVEYRYAYAQFKEDTMEQYCTGIPAIDSWNSYCNITDSSK